MALVEAWKHYLISVYTIENCKYEYSIDAYNMNRPREHAKRIIDEGYWEEIKEGEEEIFHAPWRIVKVKIRRI